MRYIKYSLPILLFIGLISVASAQVELYPPGGTGLFSLFFTPAPRAKCCPIPDELLNKKVIPNSVKLPGDPDLKKWPYPRPTDSDYEKKYKREVNSIQNSYWGSFNSLEQQRQILTGELARCRLQVREIAELITKP